MSLTALSVAEGGREQPTQDLVKYWATDADGRTVYYPYGPGRVGYLVTDAAREQALRAKVARYDDVDKRIKPCGYLLAMPSIWAFYYLVGTHPVLAFAQFAGFFLVVVLIDRLVRRVVLGNLLDGLPRAAPLERLPALLRSPGYAAFCFLVLVGVIWLVLHAYDLRVAAASASKSATSNFYPDISLYVLFAALFAVLTAATFAAWNKMLKKFSPNRMLFCVFVLIVLTVGCVGATAWNIYDPEPRVVIARDWLYCRGTVPWRDIASSSLQFGSKGKRYARLELTAEGADKRGAATASCEISGLNADYMTVYEAINVAWRKGAGASR